MTKVVLVTGASRGIGRAIVDDVLKREKDAAVYGVARSEELLSEIKEKYGNRFYYVVGDITDDSVLEKLVNGAVERHGHIDSVIANAGVLKPVQDVSKLDVASWKRLFDVNFFSVVSLTSKVIPYLSKVHGNLIFVSSGASVKPYYAWGAYGSSKAALNHFAMTVAAETSEVRSIAIAPGVVDTQMQVDITEKLGPDAMTPEALKRFIDLRKNKELLPPAVPAAVYGKLALEGIPAELNGQYLRYNDKRLESPGNDP